MHVLSGVLCGRLRNVLEFNCGDGAAPQPYANQSAANHLRFMKAALPLLEAASYVHRCLRMHVLGRRADAYASPQATLTQSQTAKRQHISYVITRAHPYSPSQLPSRVIMVGLALGLAWRWPSREPRGPCEHMEHSCHTLISSCVHCSADTRNNDLSCWVLQVCLVPGTPAAYPVAPRQQPRLFATHG